MWLKIVECLGVMNSYTSCYFHAITCGCLTYDVTHIHNNIIYRIMHTSGPYKLKHSIDINGKFKWEFRNFNRTILWCMNAYKLQPEANGAIKIMQTHTPQITLIISNCTIIIDDDTSNYLLKTQRNILITSKTHTSRKSSSHSVYK